MQHKAMPISLLLAHIYTKLRTVQANKTDQRVSESREVRPAALLAAKEQAGYSIARNEGVLLTSGSGPTCWQRFNYIGVAHIYDSTRMRYAGVS